MHQNSFPRKLNQCQAAMYHYAREAKLIGSENPICDCERRFRIHKHAMNIYTNKSELLFAELWPYKIRREKYDQR